MGVYSISTGFSDGKSLVDMDGLGIGQRQHLSVMRN